MAKFSRSSRDKLATCEHDLQTLMNEVIKEYDISVIYGHRPIDVQNELYKKGRKLIPGEPGDIRADYLIVDRERVVTYRGFDSPSNHNYDPSRAIDVVPYPSKWTDINKLYEMAGYIKAVYHRLFREGKIKNKLTFGSDWHNPQDPAHIEVTL